VKAKDEENVGMKIWHESEIIGESGESEESVKNSAEMAASAAHRKCRKKAAENNRKRRAKISAKAWHQRENKWRHQKMWRKMAMKNKRKSA
jgi:hypothetical protein